MSSAAAPNRLAQETSPYLLQHAHNPVDWYPWGEEALQRARAEQKPIVVSIGYAACHWCHVMERESFENAQVAALMNAHFVCIKVDREERPDVDQVYLEALQAMGVQGGWPLNVFLTPEAKPFYGGTYFAPSSWAELLTSIGEAYQNADHQELEASAEQVARALQTSELERYRISASAEGLSEAQLAEALDQLAARFDLDAGGMRGAPKFPLPGVWRLLLRASRILPDTALLAHTIRTVRHIAWGGIYDQIGGGFARYAVDENWLVPHFEKMLYDNGQLLSLYAEAYQLQPNELLREVVYDTVAFVQRELTSPEGGFYASLDADSEGEEGRFYVFTKQELQDILGAEQPLASAYYSCTATGNWEHGRNILHRRQTPEAFAEAHQLQPAVLAELVQNWKQKLLAARTQRPRPTLDDKVLTSWNALLLQGLLDAYRAFAEPEFLALALRNAHFLQAHLRRGPGLWHSYQRGRATIVGFLDDYAFLIQAYISLYEATFQESWLHEANRLTQYTLTHFFDPAEDLFFYTDDTSEQLIARKKELLDNVLPSSNSVMAHNLHRLGLHLGNTQYVELAAAMLRHVQALVVQQPQATANWAALYTTLLRPTAEITIVGPEAEAYRQELGRHFLPNVVVAGATEGNSELPLLTGRTALQGRTTLYVCHHHACQRPVHTVAEALTQL
ncbi:thioredoxin domain-containing protein [Hymenobacter yonginensis]|uniref:Thioredoxin domain-containing protein n=1 Tax=Hymenobacter yonginensis TaxID=748197 RepID=A0ABY7PJQ7_9BACT|nr:thioredoxin domain-containing protein [Hymenobacter yonginensis]WBO83111.1 thioredoxin domain-containing protein [Hymenobacter yonginensis]